VAVEQETRLCCVGETGPLIAEVDRTQIAVALKALVQNALEAVKQGGSVEVGAFGLSGFGGQGLGRRRSAIRSRKSAARAERRLIPGPHLLNPQSAIPNPIFLSVADTGPGIPPEIRPHIFDPFFSGREAGRGLGLGLSKAWRIVTLHGGTIRVDSEFLGGARLEIALPSTAARPSRSARPT